MTLFDRVKYFKEGLLQNIKTTDEILWAEIFNSTIRGSEWFMESISPGRWAVGYPFLYVLYRILDEVRPNTILELGLGQSSKLTCSYTKFYKNNNILHYIVEHDEAWRNFFIGGNENLFSDTISEVQIMSLETVEYKTLPVIRYKNFYKILPDEKWNLILIDAPFGSDGYSRIDVLDLIPQNLSNVFAILFDDCERKGEFNTCERVKEKLSVNSIPWHEGIYSGKKEVRIIVSDDLKFLCSL